MLASTYQQASRANARARFCLRLAMRKVPRSPSRSSTPKMAKLDQSHESQGVLESARKNGRITDFVGLLAGRTEKVADIKEINAGGAQGWAGKK